MSLHEEKMDYSKREINNQGYIISLLVDQPPKEVFNAINNVKEWWAGIWDGKIEGKANILNDEFSYSVPDVHYSKQKIIEFIPNEKVVWLVLEANLTFTKNQGEWKGTKISFEINPKVRKN